MKMTEPGFGQAEIPHRSLEDIEGILTDGAEAQALIDYWQMPLSQASDELQRAVEQADVVGQHTPQS